MKSRHPPSTVALQLQPLLLSSKLVVTGIWTAGLALLTVVLALTAVGLLERTPPCCKTAPWRPPSWPTTSRPPWCSATPKPPPRCCRHCAHRPWCSVPVCMTATACCLHTTPARATPTSPPPCAPRAWTALPSAPGGPCWRSRTPSTARMPKWAPCTCASRWRLCTSAWAFAF